jgi:uncharacterized protein
MTSVTPIRETERYESLDVLRGVGVLGILVMNIQSFAMPFAAYFNPTALGSPSDVDFTVWTISHLFADQKFMSIFSILFGAGVLLFASHAAERGGRSAVLHYRRMFWLLVFGLMHAYLIWYGDILVLYAVCGMLIYPLRRTDPRALLIAGVLTVSVASLFMLAAGLSIDRWPPEGVADIREFWSPDAATLAAEVEAFRGGWLAQMPVRAAYAFDFHTFEMWIWGIWRAGGVMLLGMALFKLGVLTGERSTSFYTRLAVIGFAIGVPLTAWGVLRNIADGWRVEYSFFLGAQWNYWGSLASACGWLGLVMTVWKSGAVRGAIARLAAVGRMAFTCYILETLICTTLFYGHAVGLFGSVGRVGQILATVTIWAALLLLAPWWLERFRYGPLEWLWRTLTYGRLEPLSRELATPSALSAP